MSWFASLFEPSSVAVYGSVSPGKIGRVLIDQLIEGGFPEVVAVNPKGLGTDDVHAVRSLGERAEGRSPVDLAIVASPTKTVPDVLEDAGRAGVRVAVIITAGFAEIGNNAGESKMLEVARKHGIRVVGPNCAGIANTRYRLFPALETRPPAGDVAFVSQSGALGGAVLSWAEEQGVGFSKFASYGNACDLTEIDFLDALREDDESKVVCLYIETVSDGRDFLRSATALAAVKPLIVIKSGRSESGGRATLSHTGSMAGSDAVYDAALNQCGAIRARGIEEMFDLCRSFVALPPMRGRRLAIVTNSGGPGVLAADRAEAEGLEVAPPSPSLRERLAEKLPPFCGFGNPFDLTVQADGAAYRDTLTEVLSECDAAVAINVNVPYLDAAPLAEGVVEAARTMDKPIVASFLAGQPAAAALPVLEAGGVPNFATPERGVHALAKLKAWTCREEATFALALHAERGRRSESDTDALRCARPSELDAQPLPWDRSPLEPEVMDWLEAEGIPVIPRGFATTAVEAIEASRRFDRPVVMKLVASAILHKTEVGGVRLGLETEADLQVAFAALQAAGAGRGFRGVLVAPMVTDAVEILVGLTTDPQFGPVIAVGLGGVFTEVLEDISLRVAPIDQRQAERMLRALRGARILEGVRGQAPHDVEALADLVVAVSELPFRFEGIRELDLNPVFVLGQGVRVGDARLIRVSANDAKKPGGVT